MTRHNIFKKDTIKAIDAAAEEFGKYPYFNRFFQWWASLLMEKRDSKAAKEAMDLGMQYAQMLGLLKDMLPLVCIDRILPEIQREFQNRNLPESVMLDSLKDIEIWVQVYKRCHNGMAGLARNEWVFRSLTGQVLRFGSLQFEEVTYEFPFMVFQNRINGRFQALAVNGLNIDQDGYISGTNSRCCRQEKETIMYLKDSAIYGYGVDLQKGIVRCDSVSVLRKDQWELVMAPGERAVAVHIPEGTDLSPEKTDLSFQAAVEYYKDRFYGKSRMFVCDSWMLDYHLGEILPKESNICQFMRRFYKLPVYAKTPQMLERVMGFDFEICSLADFSCKTSLQTKLKKYLLEGNEVFTTAGFLKWQRREKNRI